MSKQKPKLNLRYHTFNYNSSKTVNRGFQALSGKMGKKSKFKRSKKSNG